jgi:hypothetical protein
MQGTGSINYLVAFHLGDRSKRSGGALMAKLPEDLKKAIFYTDILVGLPVFG